MGKHDLFHNEDVVQDWTPIRWFPWVEYRKIRARLDYYIFFNQYRWRK